MSATRALAYLLGRSFRNRLVRQRKRLRSPTAVLGLLLGIAYLGLVFGNPAGRTAFSARPFGGAGVELAATLLLVFIGRWWLFGAERQALAFTPAEVHFLFPAPLSRRTIVAYRLARTQFVLLINAAIWTWIFQATGTPAAARFLAFWVLFGTLHMHMLGASLVRAGMLEHGAAGARRHRVAVILLGAVAVALAWSIITQADAISAADGMLATLRAIGTALQSGPAHVALAPLRFLLQPALASTLADWVYSLPLALLVAAVHLVWVLNADVAFEEAAVEASERHARRLDAWRQGRGLSDAPRGAVRTRLTLAPTGHPAVAILWKNIIAMTRSIRGAGVARVFVIVLSIVVFSALNSKREFVEMLGVMLGTWAGFLIVAGPVWVRYDFRRDLARLDSLRVLPLSGTAVAAAEVAGSAFAITALQFAMLALGGATLSLGGMAVPTPPTSVIVMFLIAAFPLNVIVVGVHNVYALSSPDAGRRASARAAGIEAFGVHLLVMLLSLLALSICLIGPGLLGGLTRALLARVAPDLALIGAAAVGIAALCLEAWGVIVWVGRVFARGEA
jgi:ABC-2 type transport system permease protein